MPCCLLCPVRIPFVPFFAGSRRIAWLGSLVAYSTSFSGRSFISSSRWAQAQFIDCCGFCFSRRFYSWGVRSSDSRSFNSSSLSPSSDPISWLVWSFHEEKARNGLILLVKTWAEALLSSGSRYVIKVLKRAFFFSIVTSAPPLMKVFLSFLASLLKESKAWRKKRCASESRSLSQYYWSELSAIAEFIEGSVQNERIGPFRIPVLL